MKAIRLDQPGASLRVEERPMPALRSGSVRVRVTRAPVLSFMRSVVRGELGYTIPTPCTPGSNAIGRVEAVAEDAFGIEPGEIVFVDPWIKSGPESALLGLTGTSPRPEGLQALYRDGTFAEYVVVPAENLTPLRVAAVEEDRLACLSYLAVPYGGLLRGDLRPGQRVVIVGATGNFGSAGVLVALAMGASRVVAVGRNRAALGPLARLDRRVSTVVLGGDRQGDAKAIAEASDGGADLVLDIMGSADTPDPTMAAIAALRPKGCAVLMGSVTADLPIGYRSLILREISIRGCFMYPREAPAHLSAMIASGELDLSPIETKTFELERVDEALDEAARSRGLRYCLLAP